MARTVCVILTEVEKARLRAISEDRARPLKHIQRARIILLSEPPRVSRRPFGLGQAAKAWTSVWA